MGTPEIKDIEVFAKEWSRWWEDINPEWRKVSSPMEKKDGAWAAMDVPGPNGFLNVLVCLLWWRQRLEEESQGWRDAMEDVTWVLKKMNQYVNPCPLPESYY
jgi:predicted phosphohydrolase